MEFTCNLSKREYDLLNDRYSGISLIPNKYEEDVSCIIYSFDLENAIRNELKKILIKKKILPSICIKGKKTKDDIKKEKLTTKLLNEIFPVFFEILKKNNIVEYIKFINYIKNPTKSILSSLEAIRNNLGKISEEIKVKESVLDTIYVFRFNTTPCTGLLEIFSTLIYKAAYKPTAGDVAFEREELPGITPSKECKAYSGRLLSQKGIKNPSLSYIIDVCIKYNVRYSTIKSFYNTNADTISDLKLKLKKLEQQIINKNVKYQNNLRDKLKRWKECKNSNTQKAKDCKHAYIKYKNESPNLKEINNKIDIANKKISKSYLEQGSIDCNSLDESIAFLTHFYTGTFVNADAKDLNACFTIGLNKDGSFNKYFHKELFCFNFHYYHKLEKFGIISIAHKNLKDFITITPDKFRKYVYDEVILPCGYPSVAENAGQQGLVYGVQLSDKFLDL